MTDKKRAFTKFRNTSTGIASRYNKKIVSIIFKSVKRILHKGDSSTLTVEAIYPYVEEHLKKNHVAVFKNDLTDIIIEIINFFIEEGDTDVYENFFDDIVRELKKTIWPSVSKLNDPEILDILIDEIFNELDNAMEYTSIDLAERLSGIERLNGLSFNELIEIAERAMTKLENMNFLVE